MNIYHTSGCRNCSCVKANTLKTTIFWKKLVPITIWIHYQRLLAWRKLIDCTMKDMGASRLRNTKLITQNVGLMTVI